MPWKPSWASLSLVALVLSCGGERQPAPTCKCVRSGDGYLMVLREGDDAFAYLKKLALNEQIQGATFTGFGFGHVTFGYFDQAKKDYDRRDARDVEVASLRGSIAWKDGAPSLHAHAVAAGRDFAALGGHLLALQVGKGSLELEIVTQPLRLSRERDEALGADVLGLPR